MTLRCPHCDRGFDDLDSKGFCDHLLTHNKGGYCPSCKGTAGFRYVRWEKFIVFEDWEGTADSMEAGPTGQVKLQGKAQCVECGEEFPIRKVRK